MTLQEDLNRLNEQQALIIKKFSKSSLIVAGPGTGKTRTISVLIGNLLNNGVRLKEILALTFSDKAALELRSRVLEYYPHSFDQCWISTFHSFCARILREQYHIAAVNPDFKLLTGFKEALMMSSICRRQQPEAFEEFGRVLVKRGFQQEILTFISLLKSNLVTPDEFVSAINSSKNLNQRTIRRLLETANLFKLYEKERTAAGYLDFRDLISLSIKVLSNSIAAGHYRRKIKVILVDEFQDTDPAQFLLLTLLKGDDNSIRTAVIGDPRQSIYRFRGADPAMMTAKGQFKKRYNAKVFPLGINYRSAQSIVKAAGRLAWQEKADDSSELISHSPDEGFIQVFSARDELEEARIISRRIASLLIYGENRKYRPDEIAILVRNNYQIDHIAECLQALHIPFDIAGDMKFFKSEEVIALASLLKVAATVSSERNESLQRAFASAVFSIDPLWVQGLFVKLSASFTMTDLLKKFSDNDFSDLPEAGEETRIKAVSFAETISILDNCSQQPLEMVFARLLLVISHLLKNPDSNQARNILHFRNMIADYCEIFAAQNHRLPLVSDLIPEFDEWLTYYASTLEQKQEAGNDGIRIMTVHQSKGLEFPVVFVCGLCEGQFPVQRRESLLVGNAAIEALKDQFNQQDRAVNFFNPYPLTHEEHLEEERRLFFVAMTRAKEGLILSYPRRNGSDPALPAPFLSEIGISHEAAAAEQRPLTIGEFRTRTANLTTEEKTRLEPVLAEVEPLINRRMSVHGVRPRQFATAEMDMVHLPEEFSFSASSLKNYIDCPRRFFFLNVLRIQNPIVAKQPYFVVGNAFHACLELLHAPGSVWESGKNPDSADLDSIFQQAALPLLGALDFFQRHLESAAIRDALDIYCNAVYSAGQMPPRQTVGVEHLFKFTFHGCRFRGRFDRLARTSDGGVIVIDYKTTGSSAKTSEKILEQAFPETGWPKEMQMPLYLLACREAGHNKVSAALLYIKQDAYKRNFRSMQPGFLRSAALNMGCGPEYGIDVSEERFTRFSDSIKAILDQIKTDQTFDCRPSTDSEARSCMVLNQNRQPSCEFLPFCQERIEMLKEMRFKDEQ